MSQDAAAPPKPNIILILVDDMGYSDIGCYGSEISTPNLDGLAAGGMRFTQMYNCARCCPSRASLMTGLYPHQAGVGHMVNYVPHPSYHGFINDRCVTIAEALKRGGYRTYLSGKWHCGGQYDAKKPETWRPGTEGFPTPPTRGFDRFYGTVAGAGNYFNPHALMEDDRFIEVPDEGYYYTDAISDEAAAMIDDAADRDEPFFLHVSYTAPHWPLHAMEEDIATYEGKYRAGWDAFRTARHEQLKGMGVLDAKWDISPRDEQAPPWQDHDAKRRDWEDVRMAVYAAQVDRMDRGVGVIVETLRQRGLLDNTLVMFLSDNGGCAEFLAEDGFTHRYSMTGPGGPSIDVGNYIGRRPGPADTFMSYDLPWANVSNTPFRLYKHWVHEGGISTPLIAHLPGMIPPNTFSHQPCHVIDLMATCLDVAGVEYPEQYNGQAITPLEGESLLPAMRGEQWQREREILWEHEGNRAVRQGQWKLVSKHPGEWELYDMNEDRTELNDLAAKNAAKVRELAGIYERFADRANVLPWEEVGELWRKARG